MAAQHMLNPKGRLAACLVTLSLLAAARSASISQVDTETQIWGGFVDGLAVSMVEPKLYDSITAKGTPIKCDAKSVANSGFDPRLPTKIITHGWMCNVDSGSGAFNIKNQFLSNGRRANVILVNWYKLFPVNVSVGTTIGAVGKRVACLVAALLDAGARLEDIHLIGHSMGSHIMGYAGSELKKTRGEVAIITGLDANSDGFIGKFHILSKNDGKFVYNFHTGGGMLGGKDPIAQIDIFYNGGNHPQPHCSLDIAGVCSHCLAFEVFIQSMYDASLVATKCSSWKDFQNGLCDSNEQIQIGLGINPQAEGSYFISADIGTNRAFSMCANWFVSNPPYEK